MKTYTVYQTRDGKQHLSERDARRHIGNQTGVLLATLASVIIKQVAGDDELLQARLLHDIDINLEVRNRVIEWLQDPRNSNRIREIELWNKDITPGD